MAHTLKIYLEKRSHTPKRIKRSEGVIRKYITWLESNNLSVEETEYRDILNYIGHLQKECYNKRLINEYLVHISHYYNSLEIDNPTIGVRLIGIEENRPLLFTREDLDNIYENYESPETSIYKETDKILLGLTIYQALDSNSIYKINLEDLNLERGKIYIPPSGSYRQERTIKLDSRQIMPLHYYVTQVRKNINNKLLSRCCTYAETLKTHLCKLLSRVRIQSRDLNLELKNLTQLRQSRYSIWLKDHGTRKAQYLGGFKNAKSLLRYQDHNIDDLKSDIEKYHPLN